MGGPRMAAAGVEIVQDAADVAVVGIQEVLAHLPAIRKAMRTLDGLLRERRPDLLVPIDFPDFNLRLARRARKAGVDVVYFVSPQVWAWRKRRVHLIRKLVRRMLVLFPFETRFYEEAGVPVRFVGHPVAESSNQGTREEWCARVGLDPAKESVALVPGSRHSEVDRLLSPMLEAAALVRRRRPETQLLIPLAPGMSRASFEGRAAEAGLADARIHEGDFPEVLRACDAGVVASGTASLEAAVAGLPIVVTYRMGRLSYLIGRALVRLPHYALPNLVLGKRAVPELIQADCNPQRIADHLLRWLEDPAEAARVREELGQIQGRLGGPGVFERAADQILEELNLPVS